MWDVSWLKQKYPLHTHRYDLVGISYQEGDRIITQGNAPGRLVNTKPWVFQTNRANVTHVEEGASDPPMKGVLIELKTPAPRPATAESLGWLAAGRRSACLGEQPGRGMGPHARRLIAGAPARRRRRRADFRGLDHSESGIRAGWNRARRADAAHRRARVHLRDQVGGER